MNAYASPSGSFSQSFEETMDTLERELHRAVAYVDRVIVPQVRVESAGALRTLAGHMERWADKLDPESARTPGNQQQ
jgi:hypothetical protein